MQHRLQSQAFRASHGANPCSSFGGSRKCVSHRLTTLTCNAGGQLDTSSVQQQGTNSRTTNHKSSSEQQDAVELLERSYMQESAPSSTGVSHQQPAPSQMRALFIRLVLPFLRSVRSTEKRLEADLATVATTVLLVVGVIVWDRGIESLLDGLLGDSPMGSVFCILFGLGLVVGVRLTGGKVADYFST